MYYIHIKFENAGLFPFKTSSHNGKTIVKVDGERGKRMLERPIDNSQLSNYLHCLFGLMPVPLNPQKCPHKISVNKRVEKIHSLINCAWIRYNGIPYVETIHTHKEHYKATAKYMKDYTDTESPINITWSAFDREFSGYSDIKNKTLNLFNTVMGCDDVMNHEKYHNLLKFIPDFKEHLKDDIVLEFLKHYASKGFAKEMKKKTGFKRYPLDFGVNEKGEITLTEAGMARCIFTGKLNSYNGAPSAIRPLNLYRGVKRKVKYNGEIVVRVEDDNLIENIYRKYGTIPTILDGGITRIRVRKNAPYANLEYVFDSFSDYKLDITHWASMF